MSRTRGRLETSTRWAVVLAVRLWLALWGWAYPAAGVALEEALAAEAEAARGWRLLPRLGLFALGVPLFARRQAAAEGVEETRTAGGVPPSTHGWLGRARAALVWATLAGWLVAFALFVHAQVTTGKFAPDYMPEPPSAARVFVVDRNGVLLAEITDEDTLERMALPVAEQREVISVQFHLAALAAGVPTLVLGGALAAGWVRRRRGRPVAR